MMRLLVILVLSASGLWSGYWWVGSTAQKSALQSWLDERRAAGWAADGTVSVTGFPNRFDAIVQNLTLADPNSEWAWAAPEFQILALSYKPNHIIAVWPGTQTIASPQEKIDITSEVMRGSVRFAPSTDLALQETLNEMRAVTATSSLGWRATLAEGQLAIRRSEPGTAPDFGYDVYFHARNLGLPDPVKDALDPAGLLPATVANAELRLTPVFDDVWNLPAVEGRKPQLTTLNIGNAALAWGAMELGVKGRLDTDGDGFATGEINVIAKNWRDMLALATTAGMIPEGMGQSVERGLSVLAQTTGDTNLLDVTLSFRGGRIWLGPIPIGPAPRLAEL